MRIHQKYPWTQHKPIPAENEGFFKKINNNNNNNKTLETHRMVPKAAGQADTKWQVTQKHRRFKYYVENTDKLGMW